jgi:hypothetical protein
MALLVILLNVLIASCKTGKVQISQIPDNINKIFQTSCMPCHGSNGGMMATSKLNFAKWDEYDSVKAATLRKSISEVKSHIKKIKPDFVRQEVFWGND